MQLLKAKIIKQKVKEAGKQINREALEILDRHINSIIDRIIVGNKEKRITEKTIQL